MMDRIMALLALLVLAAFLGILVIEVPRLDLAAVVALAGVLVVWDMIRSIRGGRR